MINKLYKLKKMQADQKIIQKNEITNHIEKVDNEMLLTQNKINTAGVTKFGAISDFAILTMHKNTMKLHLQKLANKKNLLVIQEDRLIKEILELQKESEQFSYILDEERKELVKKIILAEDEAAAEYMQSKY
ncbi:MAG: hypothetical protein HRT40_03250 [Campylobacteraceae bacterium]|nr:hypothetical protein [Campylobacteraceae bacterium]